MESLKLCESDYRFMTVIWDNEPLPSGKLVELCNEKLGWSKTTTYTVIKRLCDRGVIKNENTVVSALVSKEEAQMAEIDELVEKKFEGSLPAFIAAFAKRRTLSEKELDEVQRMIDRIRKGGAGNE